MTRTIEPTATSIELARFEKRAEFLDPIPGIIVAGFCYPIFVMVILWFVIFSLDYFIGSMFTLLFICPIAALVFAVFGFFGCAFVSLINSSLDSFLGSCEIAAISGGFTGYWTFAAFFVLEPSDVRSSVPMMVFLMGPVLATVLFSTVSWVIAKKMYLRRRLEIRSFKPFQFNIRNLLSVTFWFAIVLAIQSIHPIRFQFLFLVAIYGSLQLLLLVALHYFVPGQRLYRK